jgi:DNA polymerase-1
VEAAPTCTIVSSDKDLMQLGPPKGVSMYDTMKDRRIGEPEVIEKFGVPPDKVVDVQALAGDSVDNVPGVPGIGIKTAAQLITEYGDLETLLAKAGEIKQTEAPRNLDSVCRAGPYLEAAGNTRRECAEADDGCPAQDRA